MKVCGCQCQYEFQIKELDLDERKEEKEEEEEIECPATEENEVNSLTLSCLKIFLTRGVLTFDTFEGYFGISQNSHNICSISACNITTCPVASAFCKNSNGASCTRP